MKTSYGSGLFGGQKTITNASDENSSEESQVGAANIFNGAQKPPAAPAPKQEQSFAQMQSAGHARPAPMPFTGPSAPRQVDDDDEEELARRVRAQLAAQQAQQQAQQGSLGVQRASETLPVLGDAASAQRQVEQEQQQRMAQPQQPMQQTPQGLAEMLRQKFGAETAAQGGGALGGIKERIQQMLAQQGQGQGQPLGGYYPAPQVPRAEMGQERQQQMAQQFSQSSVPDAVREKLQAGGLMEGGATEGFTPPSSVDFNLPAGGGAPPSDGVVPTAPTPTPVATPAPQITQNADGTVSSTARVRSTPSALGYKPSAGSGDYTAAKAALESASMIGTDNAGNVVFRNADDAKKYAEAEAAFEKTSLDPNKALGFDLGSVQTTANTKMLLNQHGNIPVLNAIAGMDDAGKRRFLDQYSGTGQGGFANDPAIMQSRKELGDFLSSMGIAMPAAQAAAPKAGLPDAVADALGGGSKPASTTQGATMSGGGGASVQAAPSGDGQGAAPAQSSAPAQAQAPSQVQAQPQAQAQAQPQAQVQPSSGLNSELERRVQEAMSAPGRYDEATVKNLRAQQRAELDASFAGQLRAEKERLAQRGLAASSIGFEKESGLAGQQARAIAQMEGDLTTRVADAMAQDRQAAIANAMGLRSQTSQEGQFGQQLANQQNQFGQQLGLDTRRQSAQESQFGQQLASQESQFGKQFGLDERKVTEATRQFNANLSAESDRFAKSHGLDAERFKASNDQFQQNLAMQKDQFGQQLSYNKAQLAQQAAQFGKTYGLDAAAQAEMVRQADRKFEVEQQDRLVALLAQLPADASPEAIAAAMRGAGFDPEKYKDFLKPKSSTPASTPTPTPAPTPTPNTPVGSGSGSTTIDDYYDYMNRNNV